MSYDDYVIQLKQVNEAIESCSDENREELISLKHSIEELLSLTCDNEASLSQTETESENNIDNEYALFMAEINGSTANAGCSKTEELPNVDELKSLEGKKCRAPHTNKWGSRGYHNAMICSILDSNSDSTNVQVRILFTNPTHEEMLPCPYYFDTDCKFSEEKCKYSHGEIVLLSDLQEYIEPDFGSLKVGSEVLAKQNNKLWTRAKITRMFDSTCMVKYGTVKREAELPFDEILPLASKGVEFIDNESEESSGGEVEIDEDTINMSLMAKPSECPLGDWERFTKGIGSKLMQKMGYVVGTGLGKKSDGILDPVTAVILPAGKSLDHCMNLRENSGGDKDLFSAERKMKLRQKKQELRDQRAYERELNKKDVFTFLNDTLTTNPSDCSSSDGKSQHRKSIKNESSRDLNVASLKTDEDIRKTERDLFIIKESLTRHKDVKSQMHKSLQQKLTATLGELSSLQTKAQNIKNEQTFRKDKRKLTIF